ncbi:hypothetical protein ACIO3O_38030 [Streptomyces sp. NPDC087440]|uniref:hypothetical protein n=1 Tax=Streptomyces sp. NPDC087440 TaxID=3365790 RepID=UPI0038036E74
MPQTPTPTAPVTLAKRPAVYLLLVEDSVHVPGDLLRPWQDADRHVVHIEPQAPTDEGRAEQWQKLGDYCTTSGHPLTLLAYTATSPARAAYLARWDYGRTLAGEQMAEELDRHLLRRPTGALLGWVAIRIADGTSDGRRYADAEDARRAQPHPERCLIFPLHAHGRWPGEDCTRALTEAAHQLHGCTTRTGEITCR